MHKTDLLIIDPQNDFIHKNGTLVVPGADVGAQKLAHFIEKYGRRLNDIHVTLDSHHPFHIAHSMYWRNKHGDHPTPFTQISNQDVKSKVWMTVDPNLQSDAEYYTTELEKNGKYKNTIWPMHCLIGSWGTSVEENVFKALTKWEVENIAMVNMVSKGSNYRREHFSAVKAEVEDTNDVAGTGLNSTLIQTLERVDRVIVGGWALSHCLRLTLEDIANNFSHQDYIKKLTLLRDCTSSVTGFEKEGEDFIKEMVARGMRVEYTDTFKFSQ